MSSHRVLSCLGLALLAGCSSRVPTLGGGDGGSCGLVTCASAGAACGLIGDGCGGSLDCGGCPESQYCGGGGASKCGGDICTPATCEAGSSCGKIGDGCGGSLDCGSCASGFCGGGGPNRCGDGSYPDGGSATCTPRTCAEANAGCGPVADGCGGLIQCGSCSAPQTCGGGGHPSVCELPRLPDGGSTCTNLCLRQQSCDGGSTTTVSGTVFAPNGQDPLYGALVYVPNGPVQPFAPGVSCLTCESQVSGTPLVSATTDAQGRFTLFDVPTGASVPLVVQLGRWRRQVTIPAVAACGDTALPATLTRLPKNRSEGDIPLTAMVTGNVDALECVLRGIGLDDSEFGNPGSAARIQLFTAAGTGPGASIDANTPSSAALTADAGVLDGYDMVLFGCEGYEHPKAQSDLASVLQYANVGGRVFATHFSYTWLDTDTTWKAAADWNPGHGQGNNIVGDVDTSFAKGQAFSDWLDAVGASTAPGSEQVSIDNWRWDVDGVKGRTQSWITTNAQSTNSVQHLTFNTPFTAPADQQCGRVLFSDFHVSNAQAKGKTFPAECASGGLTAQEHILEFMLFDLASCVSPDTNPTCTPLTCAEANASCGQAGDGCGGTLSCGSCPSGQTCGGAGVPSQCGTPTCTPRSCAMQGLDCGAAGDGCGGTLDCGSCPPNQACGAGGTPNVCADVPCTKTTCDAQSAQCGLIADGCGGTLDCGSCASGAQCGVLGPNICGSFR